MSKTAEVMKELQAWIDAYVPGDGEPKTGIEAIRWWLAVQGAENLNTRELAEMCMDGMEPLPEDVESLLEMGWGVEDDWEEGEPTVVEDLNRFYNRGERRA